MQIARAPIALGALVSTAMLANSIFILPSSFGVYKEQQFKIRNSIPAILLQDNVFVDVVDGATMLIGKHGSNGVASDVFIHDTRNEGKIVTVLAETGQFIKTNGAPALVLQNGQRAELTDNTNNSAMLYFDSHTMSITATEGPKSKRMPIDMNEDTIPNLLNPAKSPSPDYFNERRAEGHYRIMSPFLGFALILIATALTLRGQIRRDLWGQRAFANIVVGIGTIILLVMSRSIATSTLNLFRCSMPAYSSQLPCVFGHSPQPAGGRLIQRSIVRRVKRMSRMSVFGLLFRYFAKRHLFWTGLCLLGLTAVVSIIQTVELIRRVSILKNNTVEVNFLMLSMLNLPAVIDVVLPFALLSGSMLCFNALNRTNEFVVTRGMGTSIWSALSPAFLAAFGVGLFFIMVINPIGSFTAKQYEKQMVCHFWYR